jgi:hypothetical protein
MSEPDFRFKTAPYPESWPPVTLPADPVDYLLKRCRQERGAVELLERVGHPVDAAYCQRMVTFLWAWWYEHLDEPQPDEPDVSTAAQLRNALKCLTEALKAVAACRKTATGAVADPLTPAAPTVPPTSPAWEEENLEALERLPRRLLRYMREREQADLNELCPDVWEKDWADLGESALTTAMSKANAYLGRHGHNRTLEKVRKEPILRWC